MKVYLAGKFTLQDEIRKKAQELDRFGVQVVSRWLEEAPIGKADDLNAYEDAYRIFNGGKDIEDINKCDTLVLFTVDPNEATKRGGRHFESGYAYGKGKEVITVGPKENIFHFLPDVKNYKTWPEALAYLVGRGYMERKAIGDCAGYYNKTALGLLGGQQCL